MFSLTICSRNNNTETGYKHTHVLKSSKAPMYFRNALFLYTLHTGNFSSTSATFQKKVFIESIIFCDSESFGKFGSKQPSLVSKETLATAVRKNFH